MKLSMWMIANRICALEPELYIEEDAPICLRSARMAYATDCVHVYQSGADAVCQGIGGKIVLRDMDCQQAFEIIQSVFDIYDDWISGLLPVAGTEDYQRIVDESRQIFQNPVIFLDGDNRVLALSSQYGEKDIDREWEHLCRYGYSSLDYIQKFRRTYSQNDFYIKNKAQLFSFGPELDNCVTMSVAVYYDNLFCGRINVLETDRKLYTQPAVPPAPPTDKSWSYALPAKSGFSSEYFSGSSAKAEYSCYGTGRAAALAAGIYEMEAGRFILSFDASSGKKRFFTGSSDSGRESASEAFSPDQCLYYGRSYCYGL